MSGRGAPEASSSAGAEAPRSARTTLADVQPLLLRPDAARTVLKPFIIDDGDGSHAPRTRRIIERVLTLGEAELRRENRALSRFLEGRHPNVEAAILDRYDQLKQFAPPGAVLTEEQKKIVGAYFSEEYAFESAALFNPSVVPHPDQDGVAEGATRVLISLRGIGEGHVSALTFRSGVWGADGRVVLDDASRYALGPVVGRAEGSEGQLIANLSFDHVKDLSETVIYPFMPSQGRGIEDVRLVAFTEDDGSTDYRGTYTAFNGTEVRQGLLKTADFRTYELRGVQGSHYDGKGMALFPRRVNGRYMMLARQDNENIWLVSSDDPWAWEGGEMIISPRYPWEFIQIGNCGSPIELDEGWLVLTHGVGSARKYCIGACLLDKANPAKLLGRLAEPLLAPDADMRDGYVPNVIYSCGALLRGRTLLVPFGVADNFTGFATVEVDKLLKAMT